MTHFKEKEGRFLREANQVLYILYTHKIILTMQCVLKKIFVTKFQCKLCWCKFGEHGSNDICEYACVEIILEI